MNTGGETIKEMQSSTGCRINVSSQFNQNDPEREIALAGTRDAINRARQAIEEKVEASVITTPHLFSRKPLTSLTQYSKSRNGPPNRPPPGGHSGGHGRDSYSQPPQQQQQQQPSWASYAQPQQAQQQPPSGAPPGVAGVAPAAADPNDPYAPYGGYQAYCAMYYAAMMQQQAAQGGAGGAAPGT